MIVFQVFKDRKNPFYLPALTLEISGKAQTSLRKKFFSTLFLVIFFPLITDSQEAEDSDTGRLVMV